MHSKFWDHTRERIKGVKEGQKWLAETAGVGRTFVNNGIARLSSPNVDSAYAIAKALKTSVEELVDGETGAEYLIEIIKNDPRAIQVPDRIRSIVECLLLLEDKELRAIRATAEELAADKKGKALEISTTDLSLAEKATG